MAELKAPVYDSNGTRTGEVTLGAEVFGLEPNIPLMHQVVTAQLAGARAGTHSTKTRGERRGTGAKPWPQKGLGRSRHGSLREPSMRKGGVAHGPKPRDYSQRTPKKMKAAALKSALSARASESAIKVVDSFDWAEPKTKQAVAMLSAMNVSGKTLVVLGRGDVVAAKALHNLPEIITIEPGQVTTYDVLWASNVIFTSATLGATEGSAAYVASAEDFVKEPLADASATEEEE
jgi:large subunit ribosomal protein L4